MTLIYVRTKPDRRAYFEGRVIPEDKFVPVTDTPYIRRLALHWEDVEVEGGTEALTNPRKRKMERPEKTGKSPSQPTKPRPTDTF